MNRLYVFLVVVSVGLNGFLAGMIAGHLSGPPAACPCDCNRHDAGPFPTGWVVPDQAPIPKPSGSRK
jgi:hypothetical protein